MSTINENNPSSYLLSYLKAAKEDRKSGDFYSFEDNKEALSFLDDKNEDYKNIKLK